MTKENWIILLCVGLILMIAAVPSGYVADGWKQMIGGKEKEPLLPEAASYQNVYGAENPEGQGGDGNGKDTETGVLPRGSQNLPSDTYEAVLEKRVKEVLGKVEGVGEVDVLIVLKSSEQKVYQTDGRTSQSATKEKDASGGTRDITELEEESSTVLASVPGAGASSGTSAGPLLEKEIRPEISGIVISAQGGGIPSVKSEITDAMVALFDLPAHKIKVLKRVE